MRTWKKKFSQAFIIWLPLALVIALLSGLIYVTVQQEIRIGANDPQIQIAQDFSEMISNGQPPSTLLPLRKVDVSKSLDVFVMFFDGNGKLIGSSAVLGEEVPQPPVSVFDFVKNRGETRITWQPRKDARSAIVVTKYSYQKNSGYVLVGRSLREVEKRENSLLMIVLLGGITTLVVSFGATFFLKLSSKK